MFRRKSTPIVWIVLCTQLGAFATHAMAPHTVGNGKPWQWLLAALAVFTAPLQADDTELIPKYPGSGPETTWWDSKNHGTKQLLRINEGICIQTYLQGPSEVAQLKANTESGYWEMTDHYPSIPQYNLKKGRAVATRVVCIKYADMQDPLGIIALTQRVSELERLNQEEATLGLTSTSNSRPVVSQPISTQRVTAGELLEYVVPAETFTDPDDDALTLTATLADGGDLPKWLEFNPDTREFLGDPQVEDVGNYKIKVTATDESGARASEMFFLVVREEKTEPALPSPSENTDILRKNDL